jgi:membrane fusion protein (multidrug efflux system)
MDAVNVPTISAAELRLARLRRLLIGGGALLLLAVGAWFYFTSGRYVSTDDAAIRAARTPISANIAGRVVEIAVRENQAVRRGDLLFRLDPRPFEIQVQEAAARLAAARLEIQAAEANYRQQLADRSAARSTLEFQRTELARQQRLVQSGITSRAQLEQAQHAVALAQQQLAAAEQHAGQSLAMLGGRPGAPIDEHPSVMQAQAALDRARLELSYTSVTAPDDGVVAMVEQLQVGSFINAATEVFTLVSTRDVWIEANFKEDQLEHMRPGQHATVSIDSYPGRKFQAVVVSLSPGTGAQFSVLPAENATGNWVKVVQRVPVRLAFADQDRPGTGVLQSGLSVGVEVDTQFHRTWFGGSAAGAHAPQ